jgi:steroid 5-alpha reductase family enzyme
MTQMLLINFLILMATIILLWLISIRLKDVSFVDGYWAFGMVIMAALAFVQTEGSPPRKALLLGLTSLWGIRLALHLFTRWRREGVDPRYARILGGLMDKKGWSFAKASLIQVFLLQAPLLFFVCLPAQVGQVASEPASLGWMAWLGAAIALIGIAFESIGDWQLRRFREDPASKGKVLDTGLWRYTRHPNYFGDCCTWWGIWLVAAETGPGRWTIVGPILLTFLLMKWSGVPLLEKGLKKNRPGYEDYLQKTPAFFPWFPKQ